MVQQIQTNPVCDESEEPDFRECIELLLQNINFKIKLSLSLLYFYDYLKMRKKALLCKPLSSIYYGI